MISIIDEAIINLSTKLKYDSFFLLNKGAKHSKVYAIPEIPIAAKICVLVDVCAARELLIFTANCVAASVNPHPNNGLSQKISKLTIGAFILVNVVLDDVSTNLENISG